MGTPTARLAALGLTLPPVAAPLAAYVPATVVGDQVWTSGQLPLVEGALPLTGLVGRDVSVEQGTELARLCALNGLAAAASVAGGLDRIGRVLKAVVYVASAPGFTGQPAVGNGASQLLGDVFGEAGAHVRSAVGAAALPLDAPVEVELVLQLAG
ncbi:RidA family protein [Desertihabitans brevis]|uniref:RidA family protein n=1 Tax=Desertihabitans brevis TaxID=2268447 RepID=A0A367YQB4_9ACTN|nr:RidA family protein [Desertihabitans brevis]RCK68034.1 RidA family protein [Desertihabitans brevis]